METAISAQQLFAALDLFPTPAVIALDGSDRVFVNRPLAQLAGIDENRLALDLDSLPYGLVIDGENLSREKLPIVRAMNGEELNGLAMQVRRADGTLIDVLVYARPLQGEGGIHGGIVTFFDVSERRGLEARQREIQSRLDKSAARLLFLAQAGEALSETLDVDAVLQTLQRIIVPRIAPFIMTMLIDEQGRLTDRRMYHEDPSEQRIVEQLASETRLRPELNSAAARVAHSGRAERFDSIADVAKLPDAPAEYRRYVQGLIERTNLRTMMIVPMRLHGRTLGIIGVSGREEQAFSDDDLRLLEEIARRTASALENAQSYQRQQRALEMMQRALLPSNVPNVPEFSFDIVYSPGDDEAMIGGDWYDAFALPDERIVVSIGDVTGRGLIAAILMGKIRHSISAISFYETDPVRMLDGADKALRRRYDDAIVTAFVGILDRKERTFTYATAGHPPPFLKRGDGAIMPLPCHGLPLGLRSNDEASPMTIALCDDDVLLLYTDGLTESTQDIVEGERRVQQALRCIPPSREDGVAHYVLEQVLPQGSRDDVAILSVRVCGSSDRPQGLSMSFDARDARMAHEARNLAATYLRELGASDADYDAAELVFGELIGNVVRHAPGEVEVEVGWENAYARLCVRDRGRGYDAERPLPTDPLSETGRGLFLVNALTRHFDVTPRTDGGVEACAILNVSRAPQAA